MRAPVVTIVDYGAGNLRSAAGAFEVLGARPLIASDPDVARAAQLLVLPGVGSFGSAMDRLQETGLDEAIHDCVSAGGRVLGICLGMQLLGVGSDEDGGRAGLALVPGYCTRFSSVDDPLLHVPHMGFNSVTWATEGVLGRGLPDAGDFYFVHSYRMSEPENFASAAIGTCNYGGTFVAGFELGGQVFGVQFHPELSQGNGLVLLRNLLEDIEC